MAVDRSGVVVTHPVVASTVASVIVNRSKSPGFTCFSAAKDSGTTPTEI